MFVYKRAASRASIPEKVANITVRGGGPLAGAALSFAAMGRCLVPFTTCVHLPLIEASAARCAWSLDGPRNHV